MNLDALLRAAQILRAQPAYAMPLAKLHARLTEELGADAGTYGQMVLALKKRPQSFMILDTPRLVENGEYGNLLDGTALGACARVALTEIQEPADAVGLAGSTLGELWQCTADDPVLRDSIAQAARDLDAWSTLIGGI